MNTSPSARILRTAVIGFGTAGRVFHAPFIEAGMPALMFHWVEDPFYHTALDLPANLRHDALDLMGAIAIQLVRAAASGEHRSLT